MWLCCPPKNGVCYQAYSLNISHIAFSNRQKMVTIIQKVTKFEVLAKRKILQVLFINYLQDFFVPRPGIEPGWVAPLVFETSASTDSAIWAIVFLNCDAKVQHFLIHAKLFELFLKKLFIYLPIPLKSSTFARRLLSTHEK